VNEDRHQPTMLESLSKVTRISVVVLGGVFVVFYLLPRVALELTKNSERKKVYADAMERVETAGGWNEIEKVCLTLSSNLIEQRSGAVFYWSRGITNPIPAVLEKLRPWDIRLQTNGNHIPVMQVRLAGMHRTGSYDQPYYGIWVVCTNTSTDYIPPIERRGHGMRGLIERKGEFIFEAK
jgi:hypothetical protein